MHTTDAALNRIAEQHHGLLTYTRIVDAGIPPSTYFARVDSGPYDEVHPGVVRIPGSPITAHQTVLAGVLAAGPDALASHSSGSWVLGAPIEAEPVHVTTPHRGRTPELVGVRVHRPRRLDGLGRTCRDGIPTVTPLGALLTVGQSHGIEGAADVLDHVLSRKLLTLDHIAAAIERHGRPGRPGPAVLRRVIEERVLDDPDSGLEEHFARLSAQVGHFVHHHVVEGQGRRAELDFAELERLVDVEVHGWLHHGSYRGFESDRERDLWLVSMGWLVVRLTRRQVLHRPQLVVAQLSAALGHRLAA